jgi:hypothetical protein
LAKEEIFWPLQKGKIFGPLGKGKIFRSYFRIVCRKGSHAGKFPKTAEHSPPLKKGVRGDFYRPQLVKSPRPPLRKGEIFWAFFGLMKSPRPPLLKGEIFWPLAKQNIPPL